MYTYTVCISCEIFRPSCNTKLIQQQKIFVIIIIIIRSKEHIQYFYQKLENVWYKLAFNISQTNSNEFHFQIHPYFSLLFWVKTENSLLYEYPLFYPLTITISTLWATANQIKAKRKYTTWFQFRAIFLKLKSQKKEHRAGEIEKEIEKNRHHEANKWIKFAGISEQRGWLVVMRANIICWRTVVINVTITQQKLCGSAVSTENFGLMIGIVNPLRYVYVFVGKLKFAYVYIFKNIHIFEWRRIVFAYACKHG